MSASRLIRIDKVKKYIEKIKNDFELLCGISKSKVIEEHRKIAFSSIAHLHNTWIERKEFETLTDEQKDCIQEIKTRIRKEKNGKDSYDVEEIHVKLYDKQKSLDSMSKLLGWNDPERLDITSEGEKITGMIIK